MLTNTQLYIISLIRKSFEIESNQGLSLSNEELNEVIHIVQCNGILPTIYHSFPDNIQYCMSQKYKASVMQTILYNYEGEAILNALSNAGMRCIALKGWELRQLYPDISMRQMADIDILVMPYNYKAIKPVMDKLGYVSSQETSWKHDNFTKANANVEMHKRLTDDSGVIQQWEKRMWKRAKCKENNIYKMSTEDFYIFHFIHLHKDFMNGSLGLRRIIDTWLLLKIPKNNDLITIEFSRMGLIQFHNRMVRLSHVLMGELDLDDNSEILLAHAFKYGIYGTDKSYKAGRIASMSNGNITFGKIKSFISAIFLPYNRMKAQFPQLEKYPALLPLYWCKRILNLLKNISKYKKKLNYATINKSDYQEMKLFFDAGGVS